MRIESLQPLLLTQPRLPGRVDLAREQQPAESTSPDQPVDELVLSAEVQAIADTSPEEDTSDNERKHGDERAEAVHRERTKEATGDAEQTTGELSEEEQEQVEELKTRDREVRTHEQAHLAAAGQYARGGPTYTYQRGPDGKRYAIGGEVQIDTSSVPDDPEATLQKAQVIRAAATAPAEPSSQDQAVAAAATKMAAEARQEIARRRYEQDEPTATFDVKA